MFEELLALNTAITIALIGIIWKQNKELGRMKEQIINLEKIISKITYVKVRR